MGSGGVENVEREGFVNDVGGDDAGSDMGNTSSVDCDDDVETSGGRRGEEHTKNNRMPMANGVSRASRSESAGAVVAVLEMMEAEQRILQRR